MSTPELTKTTPPSARAYQVLRARAVWVAPTLIACTLMFLISVIYLGSIVDPTSHLHHLPVSVVQQDQGATVHGAHVDMGQDVAMALEGSPALSRLLTLQPQTLAEAEGQMGQGKLYAAIVIPAGFTRAVLAGTEPAPLIGRPAGPTIELLTNLRVGSLGVSLATGVVHSAVPAISVQVAEKVLAATGTTKAAPGAGTAALSNFVALSTVSYRPLPANAGLGLSAFYIALLAIMCGFLAGAIINSSVDSGLGYGATEIGPRWAQRRPVAIDRLQTLLTKWVMSVALAPLLTALLLVAAVVIWHASAPHLALLWLYTSFAAVVVALGTLALFALLGSLGQLVGMLVFIYLSLASSGGTVPLQAVPGFYRFIANFEPLRQVLGGVRAIVYFNAVGQAGLDRAWLMTTVGLVVWLAVGLAATTWYDRQGLYRMQPDLLTWVNQAIDDYAERGRPGPGAPPGAGSQPAARPDSDSAPGDA